MSAFLDHDETAFRTGAERAIELNPLSLITLATSGMFFCYAGDAKRGAALVRKAMSLNPNHPGWYHAILFADAYMQGDADAALKHAHLITMSSLRTAGLYIAAAGGRFNRVEEARIGIEAWVRANNKPFDPAEARMILKGWMWEGALLEGLMDGLVKAVAVASGSPHAVEASIAVLPFADLSEKKDQDWFCEGIAEEILSALAPVPGLRVAARASAFALRDKTEDLKTIAEKLDVKSILEGSVRRAGDRVRITAQLSDAAHGRQLWSERFDRELKDIFDVQEEIARAIVDKLCLTLINDKAPLVDRPTKNMEAYELLLKGRVLVTRRGRAVADAIPLFERAIALDPNFAEAHAMLGDAYRLLCLYGIVRAREMMPKARASVERALAIDPNQLEALATFAIIASIYEWDLDELLRRSDRALAVDPSHVRVLGERAISFAVYKQVSTRAWQPEALELIARARAADPLNAWVAGIETAVLIMMDRLDDAVEAGRRAMALDESNFTAHWFLTSALAAAGREEEAFAAAEPALAMSGRHPMILTILSALHSARGNSAEVEAIRAELHARAAQGFIGEASLACVDAAAGRWDEARAMLRKAIAERDPYLTFWKLYAFRPLWSDRECADMLRATSLFDELRS
jgi:serine/threonine-protein kinase